MASTTTNGSNVNVSSHAVSRSAELLSCAKTALKIAQSRHSKQTDGEVLQSEQQWFSHLSPADLALHNPDRERPSQVLEDGMTLLRTMESELKRLEGLVRRRGHTNDPTQDISAAVSVLQQDAAELTVIISTLQPPATLASRHNGQQQQRQRHWTAIQQWFQAAAAQHAIRLKEILAVRGAVLTEQARRRQRFQTSSASSTSSLTTSAANALFALPPVAPRKPAPPRPVPAPLDGTPHASSPPSAAVAANGQHQVANGSHHGAAAETTTANTVAGSNIGAAAPRPTATTENNSSNYSYNGNGGYGGSAAARSTAGYGGSASNASYYTGNAYAAAADDDPAATGMRQRKAGGDGPQTALQQRQHDRQTATRLLEARQAEQSLAALGTVYGKMSTLIAQQSDVLTKVEDDVEAGLANVSAGHGEIITLYSIKRGNRALILKVFGLLIFLILFMRFYARK